MIIELTNERRVRIEMDDVSFAFIAKALNFMQVATIDYLSNINADCYLVQAAEFIENVNNYFIDKQK
jgi:hypothetical protein